MSPWDAKPMAQQKQEPRKSAPRIYIKFAKCSKFVNRFKVDNFCYKNWNDWFKQKSYTLVNGSRKLLNSREFPTSNAETSELMRKFWYNRIKNAGGA